MKERGDWDDGAPDTSLFFLFFSCIVSSVHHKVSSDVSGDRVSGDSGEGSGAVGVLWW